MINWQPIDTAPKDRRVLFYFATSSSGAVQHWIEFREWWGLTQQGKETATHWAEFNAPDEPI
jgi:hypothetical protein